MNSKQAFELATLDAVGQAALAASGEVTAAELLEAAIVRLEAARDLNAVIADLFDRGREQAAALEASGALRSGDAGPVAGAPFLLKDLGGTGGDGLACAAHTCRDRIRVDSRALPRGRPGGVRQDEHPRVG